MKHSNISENDIKILAQQLKDPWFQPEFSLTEFFGDVEIQKKAAQRKKIKKKRASSRTCAQKVHVDNLQNLV